MEPAQVRAPLVPERSWSRTWEPQAGVADPCAQPLQRSVGRQGAVSASELSAGGCVARARTPQKQPALSSGSPCSECAWPLQEELGLGKPCGLWAGRT
ncbi:hypothetical protein MC885_011659, partial [Smutsia gigantea]